MRTMRLLLTFAAVYLGLAGHIVATPLKRDAPTLVISTSTTTPNTGSTNEIEILVKVENTSDQNVKVLKHGSVLDNKLPTQSFTVTQGDQPVAFTGISIQLNIHKLPEDAYVVIPAGQSVEATHTNLAGLYAFHEAGTGIFTFTPKQDFLVLSANGLSKATGDMLTVIAEDASVDVHVSRDVSKREMEERSVVACSDTDLAAFLSTSYRNGITLAQLSAVYISSVGSNDTLFQAYFGVTTSSIPYNVFNAIATENSTTRELYCSDPHAGCGQGVVAYTVVSNANIYYCPLFFTDVPLSYLCDGRTTVDAGNIAAGSMLHMLATSVVNTDEHAYGCPADRTLAASSPSLAMNNTDTYNCFATEVFLRLGC